MSSVAGGNNEVISIDVVLNPIIDKSELEKEINQSKEPQVGDTKDYDNTTRNNADNVKRDSQGRLGEEFVRDSNGQVVPVGSPAGGVAGGTAGGGIGSAATGAIIGSQFGGNKSEIEELKKQQSKLYNEYDPSLVEELEYKEEGRQAGVRSKYDENVAEAMNDGDIIRVQKLEDQLEIDLKDSPYDIAEAKRGRVRFDEERGEIDTKIKSTKKTEKPSVIPPKTDITKGKTPSAAPDSTTTLTKIKASLGLGQKGAKNVESLATNPEALIGGNLKRLLPAAGIIGIIALALLEAPNFMKSIVKALAVKGGPLNQDFHRFIADEVQLGINRDLQWRRSRGLDVIITTDHRDYILSDPAFISNSLVDGDPTRSERLNSNETKLGYGNGL